MTSPLSFQGQTRRLPYALWSFGLLFSQHLVAWLALRAQGIVPMLDAEFVFLPLRSLVTGNRVSDLMLLLAFAYFLMVAGALCVLAFRRAADANINETIAVAAMVPVLQILVIAYLCQAPMRAAEESPAIAHQAGAAGLDWAAAVQGVIAGMGLTLLAVAISTLVFGVYGFGIFLGSPFVIGLITAYLANRKRDIGVSRTTKLVLGATVLGGIGLVLAALEGIVCIVLASPLAFGTAWIGGLLGHSLAVATRRSPSQILPGVALLPLLFALESVLPATTSFDTTQAIEVNAPPEAVWRSLVHMTSIDVPLALPFRLGVAYPLRGEIVGEGVGALRYGEFSTGTAIERVTEWIPNQKLAFAVLNEIPAMRELSPYRNVHAPHVVGYFRTSSTSFELMPRPGGGTEVIERTSHELKLDPVLYWLPLARWMVHENNARVLAHIRGQAERHFAIGG